MSSNFTGTRMPFSLVHSCCQQWQPPREIWNQRPSLKVWCQLTFSWPCHFAKHRAEAIVKISGQKLLDRKHFSSLGRKSSHLAIFSIPPAGKSSVLERLLRLPLFSVVALPNIWFFDSGMVTPLFPGCPN